MITRPGARVDYNYATDLIFLETITTANRIRNSNSNLESIMFPHLDSVDVN